MANSSGSICEVNAFAENASASLQLPHGYTNDRNPFNDPALSKPFVWRKKIIKDVADGKKIKEQDFLNSLKAKHEEVKSKFPARAPAARSGVSQEELLQVSTIWPAQRYYEHIAEAKATAMSSVKKLINDPNDAVTECIEGLVETYPGLQYLDGFPEVKVVLRADISRGTYEKVAIISGGGSGHEPAQTGYVGPGMLTAAVCGDVFTSPSVHAILAGIRAVTGPKGCLLIVMNYTGDRLNFGLAAEQAKAEGLKVEMVIVGDDCALLAPPGLAGRRGLAGTIFVHKVAGAAADAGLNLLEVTAEATRVAQLVGTMGVALSVCTIPGQAPSDRLGPGKIELGIGIHGEPGAAVADIQPVDVVVSHVLKRILSAECIPVKPGRTVALMVNGLGATPLMKLMIAARKAVSQLQLDYGVAVARVYTGCFMTSLDTAGMSISILKVDDTVLPRLDALTKAPAWPVGVSGPRPPTTIPVPLPPSQKTIVACRPRELNENAELLEAAIEAGAEAIIKMKDVLNEWDSKVGDGDCGTRMWKGANAVLEDVRKHYPLNDPPATINELGGSIRRVMGGNSGVLYDILSKAAFVKLKERQNPPTAKCWVDAFDAAVAAVSRYGGASAGYRTMLDALLPAVKALQEGLDAGEDGVKAFITAAEAAQLGAESTKSMQAQAGNVPPDVLATVPDPGAMAVAAWLGAAADAVASDMKLPKQPVENEQDVYPSEKLTNDCIPDLGSDTASFLEAPNLVTR